MARTPKIPDKLCLKCGEVKPTTEFYANSGWKEQNCCDRICRVCAKKMIVDKDTARQYFWENNRVWSDKIWEAATNKALSYLVNNQEYVNKRTTPKRKEDILLKHTASMIPSVMNNVTLYKFIENNGEPFNPDSVAGTTAEGAMTRDDEALIWSDEWGGMYSKRELKYLDAP